MLRLFAQIVCIPVLIFAQQQGNQKQEYHLPITVRADGSQQKLGLVLDSNWRWLHETGGYTNCYEGSSWSSNYCPDGKTCSENCALEGVPQDEWTGTYGIQGLGQDGVSLKLVTRGPYSTNIGSRLYLTDSSGDKYQMLKLLNKEFSFDVDLSQLDCGLNGALYLVEMAEDGGASFAGNKAGAKYGTGYCDAQCPHDIKFIEGEANVEGWKPSETDPNSGTGKYGSCCAEMDLWEANARSQAFTTHPCDIDGQMRCEGTECGDNDTDERYDGVCDKDGCDFASYRLGDQNYYGKGQNFKINTENKMTVVTQFITSDGTDNGDLVEVRRIYKVNGQIIENSKPSFDEISQYDSLSDDFCMDAKNLFGDYDDHSNKGGLKKMGDSMKNGMVLVLSLWDDHAAHMLWLDSNYPEDADPNQPGIARGPCSTDSGNPDDVQNQQPDATVKFSNIAWGPIGSTI